MVRISSLNVMLLTEWEYIRQVFSFSFFLYKLHQFISLNQQKTSSKTISPTSMRGNSQLITREGIPKSNSQHAEAQHCKF